MDVWYEKKTTGNPLTDAYLRGDSLVADLYDYPSSGHQTLHNRANELDLKYEDYRREQVVLAISQYMQRIVPDSPAVSTLLDKFSQNNCVAVVTGQQAGLFTGPLYTLYKAMSCVVLAKEYETLLRRPVVPVFWIATEDHDFDEVASAYYVLDTGDLARSHLHERPPLRTPVGKHDISRAEFIRLMNELSVSLPEGTYREDVLHDIDNAYRATANMGDFFAKLLTTWLKDLPMLLINPLCKEFREPVRDAFSLVLDHPSQFRDAALFGARQVVSKGYTPQVEVPTQHSLLYLIDEGRRCALDIDPEQKERFIIRDSGKHMTTIQLKERLEVSPQDFSAGVLYRPVVQEFLLPVLTYVGGGAEIAYHGMMKQIFHAASRKMPPLRLRQRICAIPRRVSRALRHYEVDLSDALAKDVLEDILCREFTPSIDDVMQSLQQEVMQSIQTRLSYFMTIDKDLQKAVLRTEYALRQDLARLQGRAHKTLRRNRSEVVHALTMVHTWLRPKETEQERVLSPLSLLTKYGLAWLPQLAARPSPQWDEIVYLRW